MLVEISQNINGCRDRWLEKLAEDKRGKIPAQEYTPDVHLCKRTNGRNGEVSPTAKSIPLDLSTGAQYPASLNPFSWYYAADTAWQRAGNRELLNHLQCKDDSQIKWRNQDDPNPVKKTTYDSEMNDTGMWGNTGKSLRRFLSMF